MQRVSIVSHKGRAPGPARLTPTQRKVMESVHSGLLKKQIASALGVDKATVKAHMTALMRKLSMAESSCFPRNNLPRTAR